MMTIHEATTNAPQITPFPDPTHQPFVLGHGRAGALLIHGFMGTPAEMRPLAQALVGHDHTAHGLLLPGFGPDLPRLKQIGRRDWLSAATETWVKVARQHTPSVLIGYSMGAAIALHVATHTPPDVLILLAPFWRINNWLANLLPIAKYLKPTISPFEMGDINDPAVREQIQKMLPEADLDDPVVIEALKREATMPTAVLDDMRALGASAYKLAPDITCPTLIIQGTQDDTVDMTLTRKLIQQIKAPITYHEIADGHDFPKNNNRFKQLVVDYLDQVEQHLPQSTAVM
jgi:carboxylesterase